MVYNTLFARNYPELSSSEIVVLHRKETLLQSIGSPWSLPVHWLLFYRVYFAYGPGCINMSIQTVPGFNRSSSDQRAFFNFSFWKTQHGLSGEEVGPRFPLTHPGLCPSPALPWGTHGSGGDLRMAQAGIWAVPTHTHLPRMCEMAQSKRESKQSILRPIHWEITQYEYCY